jgi:hypothetical protein
MPIKAAFGTLSFTEIEAEFDNPKPWSLGEFYGVAPEIPLSGTIKFSDFYGTSDVREIASNAISGLYDPRINGFDNIKNCNLWTLLTGIGFTDPSLRYDLSIPLNVWFWGDSPANAGLTIPSNMTGDIIIRNNGNIIGCGGKGGNGGVAGENGGPAIKILTNANVTILNNINAYIAGGGGGGGGGDPGASAGGGGGAGGGAGGSGFRGAGRPGVGGILGATGGTAPNDSDAGGGKGGGAGGGGGGYDNGSGLFNDPDAGSGGGGGRILPGVGGAGSTGSDDYEGMPGGSAGASGQGRTPAAGSGGGGGGWGANGGRGGKLGGTGGKAVETTSPNVSIVNTGTIYGLV